MTDKGQTSSMTSVTEEDSSADSESDTTESTNSIVTSSLLSSSDYNTDDKLTHGLVGISISHTVPHTVSRPPSSIVQRKGKSRQSVKREICESESVPCIQDSKAGGEAYDVESKKKLAPIFPYGANPLPLTDLDTNHGITGTPPVLERCVENLGVDDPEDKLSTDFSDTSSVCRDQDRTLTNESHRVPASSDSNSGATRNNENNNAFMSRNVPFDQRPYFPDLTSQSWHHAQCFDHYWSNYQFVMKWYQVHIRGLNKLSEQLVTGMGHAGAGMTHHAAAGMAHYAAADMAHHAAAGMAHQAAAGMAHHAAAGMAQHVVAGMAQQQGPYQARRQQMSNRARKARRSKRARNRRLAKERHRASVAESAPSGENSRTETAASSDPSDNEVEMEITDEMVQFFATSAKHKMERENEKVSADKGEEKVHVNIEKVMSGQPAPSTSAPVEQPGVRRTVELKYLYGSSAPMIHGMETALQLTFDRITDKLQPKLWPNMPLKINFA